MQSKNYFCQSENQFIMNFIGIIPARFQSTRFPGKPLAMIHGKPMIQWVVERAHSELDQVWVATDHLEIANAVNAFGGHVIMTSQQHSSGTDRCAEAARKLSVEYDFDVVINIQGDEPFIYPEQIRELKSCFTPDVQIATLIKPVSDLAELENPNKPKVVIGKTGQALYFSRSIIPFLRGTERTEWLTHCDYWSHIGLYGYRKDILQEITLLQPGKLEKAEALEQLRWIENGYQIITAISRYSSFGIDTPEDLEFALKHFRDFFVY
jgi:3-deoxy-manno-octulosonate cytidylyltransferase (CMP-KDO synthetase)